MAITFARIETLVRYILKDSGTPKRWTQQEILDWGNAVQRMAVSFKPDINTELKVFALAAGAKQAIPTGYLQPLEFIRNMGTGGATPGRAITMVSMADLAEFSPSWLTDTAAATVIHAAYGEKSTGAFYVYPPQPSSGQGQIEVLLSKYPTDMTVGGDMGLADEYESLVVDGILYYGFLKDADNSTVYMQRAIFYWNMFVTALDRKDLVIREKSPNSPPEFYAPKPGTAG